MFSTKKTKLFDNTSSNKPASTFVATAMNQEALGLIKL